VDAGDGRGLSALRCGEITLSLEFGDGLEHWPDRIDVSADRPQFALSSPVAFHRHCYPSSSEPDWKTSVFSDGFLTICDDNQFDSF
jgi:hypothetical protein